MQGPMQLQDAFLPSLLIPYMLYCFTMQAVHVLSDYMRGDVSVL